VRTAHGPHTWDLLHGIAIWKGRCLFGFASLLITGEHALDTSNVPEGNGFLEFVFDGRSKVRDLPSRIDELLGNLQFHEC
jgi:hypothetical protein